MNTNRSRRLPVVLTVVFLCLIHAAFSSSREPEEQGSPRVFLLIGQIQEYQHIHWREQSTDSTYRTWLLPDGTMVMKVSVEMPLMNMALVLQDQEIFALTEKGAVRVNTDKQIVLILGRRGRMTEAMFKEVAGRLHPQQRRFLYYVERFEAPDGLIKKYKLEDSVIFQDQDRDMPKVEGTREFDLELKKYGISLSRSETNIVSQIPPEAPDDLPVGAEGGTRQSDEASPE